MPDNSQIAIVLLNLGGPDSLDSVEPFLYNLFSDPDIIDFPLSFLFRKKLAKIISSKRAPKIQEQYKKIGGKSPILDYTRTQAKMLQERLAIHNSQFTFHVFMAMRYWHPFTDEIIEEINKKDIKKILLLPLYPHYSKATTGSNLNEWNRLNPGLETIIIKNYHLNTFYIKAIIERINESLNQFPENKRNDVYILFSAHGSPLKLVKQGDPYSFQIKETVDAVIESGGFRQKSGLSFQSKVGPLKWLTPSTHDTIIKLGQDNIKHLLIVPISFVSDHLETLYEINIEYRRLAVENGIEHFGMTQGLNDSPYFIDALEDIILKKFRDSDLRGVPTQRVGTTKQFQTSETLNNTRSLKLTMSEAKAREGLKIAIIGGGISGLTIAYLLNKNGFEVKLFEKNTYPGGNIKTENINGFLIEHGPNSTLETSPLLNQLFNELGIFSRKVYASDNAKKRYILKNGKLHALPLNPLSFLASQLFSAKAKLRLLKEPFIHSKSNPSETIAEFTQRRLGKEFLDYAIDPFVAGVFAGDPFNLNVKTAFPKLYDLEQNYGSLIKGAFESRKERKASEEQSKQSAKSFSFKNGMGELVDSLYNAVKNISVTNAEVTQINTENSEYEIFYKKDGSIQKKSFDIIVLAVPAYAASNLLRNFDNGITGGLGNIYYPPVTVVTMGFKNDSLGFIPDGFGFLVPKKENRKILGSLWTSAIFSERAPEGYSLLTNFIGGSRNPELAGEDYDTLTKIVLNELNSIMGLKGSPEFVKIIRWNKAIPQYGRGHSSLTEKLNDFQNKKNGIYICNNYYKGISVCDCIVNAHKIYDRILNYHAELFSASRKYTKILNPETS